MTEMRIARFSANLRALHSKGRIALFYYVLRLIGLVKLGQPVPLSNLSSELNSGSPVIMST